MRERMTGAASFGGATRPPRTSKLQSIREGYGFLMPWLAGLLGLTLGPALFSLYLSFTKYDLVSDPKWIGMGNYVRIFSTDPKFWIAMKVTFTYVFLSVPLKLGFALAIAMMLNKGLRGLPIYRALFYLPSLLGGSVAIAILWRQVFSSGGLFNQVLAMLGIKGMGWVSTPETALYTLVLLTVWQFGSSMIIFLAGLRQIPADMYEAASIDGASPRRQFFRITLPLLTPVIFFNAIVQTIDAFKAFNSAFIISDGTGGPVNATLFYTLYLFQEAFSFFRMGYAAALAWVLVMIIGCITAISFFMSRYWVHYDE